jgi:hypothetical protein
MTAAMTNWAVLTFAAPAAARAALQRSGRLSVGGRLVGVQPFRAAHLSSHGRGATAAAAAVAGPPGSSLARAARMAGGDGDSADIDAPGATALSTDFAAGRPDRGHGGAHGLAQLSHPQRLPGPVAYDYDDQVAVAARVVDVDVFADATTQRRLKNMTTCQKFMRFVMNF